MTPIPPVSFAPPVGARRERQPLTRGEVVAVVGIACAVLALVVVVMSVWSLAQLAAQSARARPHQVLSCGIPPAVAP